MRFLPLLLLGLCAYVVCSHVVVLCLSVTLSQYPMWVRVLLFVLHVSMVRECEYGERVTAMLVWGMGEV